MPEAQRKENVTFNKLDEVTVESSRYLDDEKRLCQIFNFLSREVITSLERGSCYNGYSLSISMGQKNFEDYESQDQIKAAAEYLKSKGGSPNYDVTETKEKKPDIRPLTIHPTR